MQWALNTTESRRLPEEHLASFPTGRSGVDDLALAAEGKAWVEQGTLEATVVSEPRRQITLEMLVRAIRDGAEPPLRTLIALNSYPPLEDPVRERKSNGCGEMSSGWTRGIPGCKKEFGK
jgi:hypothetical protein